MTVVNTTINKGDIVRPYFYYAARYFYYLAAFLFISAILITDHYYPWLLFHSDFLATLGIGMLLVGVTLNFEITEIPVIAIVLLVVSTIPLVQILFGQIIFLGDGVMASAYLFGFTLSVIIGHNLSINGREIFLKYFACCVLFVAVLSAFIAIDQWQQLNLLAGWTLPIKLGVRPSGNIAQPNNLASLLCLGLISAIYIREKALVSGFTAALLSILLFIGLALTQSRTAWLMVAFIAIWWLWKRRHKGLKLKLEWFVVVGFVGLYAALIFSLPAISDYLYLSADLEVRSAEVGLRGVIWLQLLDALCQQPVWGYGWNQVSYAQLAVAADSAYPMSGNAAHSHNLFIDLLIWNGIPVGGTLILCIIGWGLKHAIFCRSLSSWFALACVGALMTHSLLEFPHEIAYFLFPIGLVIGSLSSGESYQGKVLYCPRWVVLCVITLSGIFLANIYTEYRLIEEDVRLARFESAGIGRLKAEQKAPDVDILDQLREQLRFARTEARPGMDADEIKWMENVAHRYASPGRLFRYSLALFLNNRPADGEVELVRIRHLHGEQNYIDAKGHLKGLAEKYPQLQALDLP